MGISKKLVKIVCKGHACEKTRKEGNTVFMAPFLTFRRKYSLQINLVLSDKIIEDIDGYVNWEFFHDICDHETPGLQPIKELLRDKLEDSTIEVGCVYMRFPWNYRYHDITIFTSRLRRYDSNGVCPIFINRDRFKDYFSYNNMKNDFGKICMEIDNHCYPFKFKTVN